MTFESFASAHSAVLWGVFAIALILGAVANKTNFCTMGAVSDLVNMGDTGRFRAWLLAMALAMIGVLILEATGTDFGSTIPPYRNSNFAWFEYILGGTMFGIGMTLGSGCGNKTLIRFGGGNIKSIFLFVMIAICAYFMLNPFPGTDKTLYSELFYYWTNPLSISMDGPQDLGSITSRVVGGEPGTLRLVIGAIIALGLLAFVFKSKDFRGNFDNILGGGIVGLCVFLAWLLTSVATIDMDGDMYSWTEYTSDDNWDMLEESPRPRDVGIQSYTFINPMGQTIRYGVQGFDSNFVTFGLMAVLGVILGSLLWSLVSRGFRIEWFASGRDFVTHIIGGILMGIGGVLGLGCTIGQGVTGASTLALGSFFTFGSIVFGSALTMKIQYYKLVYEEEATFIKALAASLADMRLLPQSLRQLEKV